MESERYLRSRSSFFGRASRGAKEALRRDPCLFPSKSGPTMTHRSVRTFLPHLGIAAALAGFVACQSTGSDATSNDPLTAYASFSIGTKDSAFLPDSVDWSAGKQSGRGRFGCVDFNCTDTLSLAHPLGSDTLRLRLTKFGLHFATFHYTQSGRTPQLARLISSYFHDTVATHLLSSFYDLREAKPDSFAKLPAPNASQLAAFYARLVFTRATGTPRFPDSLPKGMSADSVRRNLVRLGAQAKSTWTDLVAANWGLDSAGIRSITRDLIQAGQILSSDAAALFPAPPVRVPVPLEVAGDLVAGGGEPSIAGRFAWDSGAVTLVAGVKRGEAAVKTGFDVLLAAAPGSTDTSWSASNLVLRAKEGVDTGRYVLWLSVTDSKGRSATAETGFRVVPAPAGAPQLVRRLPTQQEGNVLPFDSAELRTEWVVRNPANFDDTTFQVDGIRPAKVDDSLWRVSIPLAPDGKERFLAVKARSKSGAALSDYLKASRSRDTAAPVLAWESPTADLLVDFSVASLVAKVRATDPSGIDSVWIDGVPAVLSEGAWKAEIQLAPDGRAREVRAVARDSAGNKGALSIRLGRGRDNVRPTVVRVAPPGILPHDSTSLVVRWIVTDNQAVGPVTIGDSLASREGDAYSRRVPLQVGANRVVLQAADTTGNDKLDTVLVVRAAGVPVHHLAERRYIGRMWDTVTSVDADSMEWSLDGKAWSRVTGPLAVERSGTYQVRAWPGPATGAATYTVAKAIPALGSGSNRFFAMIGDTLFQFTNGKVGRLEGGVCFADPQIVARGVQSVEYVGYDGLDFLDMAGRWKRYVYRNEYNTVSDTVLDRGVAPNGSPIAQINRNGWKGYLGKDGVAWMGNQRVFEGAKRIERGIYPGSDWLWSGVILDRSGVLWKIEMPSDSSKVTAVRMDSGVADVESDGNSTFVLMQDGTVKAKASWNGVGQLGVGDLNPRDSFVVVRTGVASVSIGYGITSLLLRDGTLLMAGANSFGQLGLGSKSTYESILGRAAMGVEYARVGGGSGEGVPLGMLSYVTSEGAL